MGEAILARASAGGGSGLGEATYLESMFAGGYNSTTLDPERTYLLVASRGWNDSSTESVNVVCGGGAYLLKDGSVSVIADTNSGYIDYIHYDLVRNKIGLDYADYDEQKIDIYELS